MGLKMPRDLPKHVELWIDRHGRPRCYFRKGKGARIALPTDLASSEFEAAYSDALAGIVEAKRAEKSIYAPGTMGALVVYYLKSSGYLGLRDTSRRGYRVRLEIIRTAHGHRLVAEMTREGIVTKILQPYADRPGQRLALLKMLRILIRHAVEIGWLKHDPSLGIKRPKTQEIRSWTDAEIGQFEKRWPADSRQRLAFALMLYTGQRRSDVHRMTWGDVEGHAIRVTQQKTGAKLTIRLHRELRAVLATAARDHVTILNTAYGRPFTVNGFSGFMRDAITAAGLPIDAQPHGLRKAAGRRLAEAGCSANQIMAILGHKTLAEAERYTREADQTGLAKAAILKLEGQGTNRNSQTSSKKFGEVAKKKGKSI